MFRETNQTASKIIELIQTLPAKEQKMIVRKLSSSSKRKPKKVFKGESAAYLKKIEKFQKYVEKHRFELPKGYKFDRAEANIR
ncbi:MAG: hypothetical protein JWO06_3767 [Bacteroidota bacterium]|nr:hypothetical protein [Bacteroidota bacterium]